MIGSPALLSLLVGSVLTTVVTLLSAFLGFEILLRWDRSCPLESQLRRERRTYLISTAVTCALALRSLALALFVLTADRLHGFFTGAMCAAGTLNANQFGYPTLLLMILNSMLCGLWLIVNRVDQRAYDYPLIRHKYLFLGLIAPGLVVESVLLVRFVEGLDLEIITSCCGVLFGEGREHLVAQLAYLPASIVSPFFWGTLGITLGFGVLFYATGRCGGLFSLLSMIMFPLSIIAIISFVCLYYYELPTHHCPFCLLQGEYQYVGYPLYTFLLLATVTGMAVGVLQCFERVGSLRQVLPEVTKKLAVIALACFFSFGCLAVWPILSSDFRLVGS